jgi:hypothetical protein
MTTAHTIDMAREIERGVLLDDGRAAKAHLAAGRAIYYEDHRFPGQTVREFPDGRRQLVAIDQNSVVTVLEEL